MSETVTREIHLEEFVPTEDVNAMAGVAEALLQLGPRHAQEAADDLRRGMVWLQKYIAPASEYWQWPILRQAVDDQIDLTVTFIGLGWLVGLVQEIPVGTQVNLRLAESRLAATLDQVTRAVPVSAVMRLKATPWSGRDIRELVAHLNAKPNGNVRRERQNLILQNRARISLGDGERLEAERLSTDLDVSVRNLLIDVRRWVNEARRFEGAAWCAYKRRRLTTVVNESVGHIEPTLDEVGFTDDPSGLYRRQFAADQQADFDLISPVGESTEIQASVLFPIYPYHEGVVNPRMIVRAMPGFAKEDLVELRRYYSYLWVNHYSRLWRYLEFEDQFAYTNNVRRLRRLDDDVVYSYADRLLRADELRASIDLANRIDQGRLTAYRPPHEKFTIIAGRQDSQTLAAHLRQTCIPSTVTQLVTDPLPDAPKALEEATGELIRTYTTFTQVASLKMQRVLQVLQAVFIVAGIAQVLELLPVAEIVSQGVRSGVAGWSSYQDVVRWKESISWLRNVDLLMFMVQSTLLLVLSVASIAALRSVRLMKSLKRLFE